MDPTRIKHWLRFREQVLQNPNWPRGLWFAALEDGLRGALEEDSPLLANFRRDRAELLRLERRASGSYQDARRIAQLEAQIRQLVDLADRNLVGDRKEPAEPAPPVNSPPEEQPSTTAPRGRSWRVGVALTAAGCLLLALGISGASLFYESRLQAQAERQMARMDRLLDQRTASLHAELDRRFAALVESDGGVSKALRQRAAALGRDLDELSLEVSSLEMRLPALDREVGQLATDAGRMADHVARAGAEVDDLKAAAPALSAWLARQRETLERDVQGGRDTLKSITDRVQSLAREVDESRSLLVDLNDSLVQGLERARADGETLKAAVDGMRATGLEVAKLMEDAESRVQAAQAVMQAKIDKMLTDLAEQADLAVLRGGDVIRRAEAEVARRVDVATEEALQEVAEERAAKLAALAERVSATQRELEETRLSMLESWERLDDSVAARQNEVLTSLDAYAGTIGVRVEELLQALDLMVARSGG